jgi:hypothetical protein
MKKIFNNIKVDGTRRFILQNLDENGTVLEEYQGKKKKLHFLVDKKGNPLVECEF